MTDIEIYLPSCGGPEKLISRDRPKLQPGAGEIVLRQSAIGVNYVDVYHRTGTYALPSYPAVLGVEAAGVVEAVGDGVQGLKAGDRVAYAASVGAYASTRILPAQRAVLLPDDVSFEVAASSLLKGMTAYMLLHKTYPVQPNSVILVHAAAGGLGAILVKWAKQIGAEVIGTAGSPAKADLARSYGADHLVVGRDADIVAEIRDLTLGKGVDVAYDGIGSDMLARTIACVRPFGTIASIGQAAGPIPPVPIEMLRPGKSLTLPTIMAYSADETNYREAAEQAMKAMQRGICSTIAGRFSLKDAAAAHVMVESGQASGSLILVP